MNGIRICLAAAVTVLLTGCSMEGNSVLFVTDTSLGINVDSKPAIASVAYDRTEGFIGPRSANGVLPPVIASIQTSGDIFEPQVRQVYATGAAAEKAVGTANVPDGPDSPEGDDNKLVFFGTSTTVGLKVGFSDAVTPDSMVFGYKRKEFSLIPLGTADGSGTGRRVYPSVLASVDTTVATTKLQGTGLSMEQFFATGRAAETIAANNQGIRHAFTDIATTSMTPVLSPEQKQAALDAATAASSAQDARVARIMAAVAPGGILDRTTLKNFVDAANTNRPGSVPPDLADAQNAADVRARIENDQIVTSSLAAVLNASGHS